MSQAPTFMRHSITSQVGAVSRMIDECTRKGHKHFGYATDSIFELHLDQLRAAAKTLAFVEQNEAVIRAAIAAGKGAE
jgi:hypothetical protein